MTKPGRDTIRVASFRAPRHRTHVSSGVSSPPLPEGYPAGPCDEMVSASGQLKPAWAPVARWLAETTPAGRELVDAEIRRLLRENGVTYSVHGEPDGEHRPWQLDAIPWMLPRDDWAKIEAGLIQRAEVLDAILTDLYGERRLVREGWIPPELISAHRGYLHPCSGMSIPSKRQLVITAADLARGPDGRMWVINDRAQAPSGFGYVIENRVVMTRAAPRLFHSSGVRRLAGFFHTLRETLESFPNRSGGRAPRVVILTPGPQNETYYEHTFLASYLGYSLVQGDDLTVRDGCVWLGSLGGLEPVDVILRRVDAWFCDPLELKEDSQLGVPGLLEAARLGNVTVINHPGSGILENPGLMAFLPGICRHLRGEELMLPSAATWWCGGEKARAHVLANLPKLIIKGIHRAPTFGTIFGSELDKAGLDDLRRKIIANPEGYVAQEQVGFSTVPCLQDGILDSRRGVIRGFVTSSADGDYIVMPGSLTRVAAGPEEKIVSSQLGGISKDTWILGPDPEPYVSLIDEHSRPPAEPDARSVPSRAGENLFWTGRYSERAEATARLLRRTVLSFVDGFGENDREIIRHREILMQGLAGVTNAGPFHPGRPVAAVRDEAEVLSLLTDPTRSGSLPYVLHAFRSSVLAVRDLWSPDSWRVIDLIISDWAGRRTPAAGESLDPFTVPLNRLIIDLSALLGLNLESMTRDAGWRLLDAGRRIERGLFVLGIIRHFLVAVRAPAEERLIMESVLAASDSLVTYRKRYRTHPRLDLVLELLLLEPNNARSLLYQIERLVANIDGLPRQPHTSRLTPEQRLLIETSGRLRLARIPGLVAPRGGNRDRLEEFAERMTHSLTKLSDALTLTYFRHADRPHFLRG